MHSKVPKFKPLTCEAAKEEFILLTILPQECFLFESHDTCPTIATQWIGHVTNVPAATPLPVLKNDMPTLVFGMQSTPVNPFLGDMWRCLRHGLQARAAVWIKDIQRKERVSGFLRKCKRRFQSMPLLSERIKSVEYQFLNDSWKDSLGSFRERIAKSRQWTRQRSEMPLEY